MVSIFRSMYWKVSAVVCIGLLTVLRGEAQRGAHTLSFKGPAAAFTEALPLGNGSLGALISGNPNRDRIWLNEISMWSGGIEDPNNPEAHKVLPAIQSYLLNGDNQAAQRILQTAFVSLGKGSGNGAGANVPYGCYQTLGDLLITWKDTTAAYTHYARSLDLEKAVATTTWQRNGVTYTQTAFVSKPQQAIIVRITADKPGSISFSARLFRHEHVVISTGKNSVILNGQLPNGNEPGLKYAAILEVLAKGGSQRTNETSIDVDHANECLLVISAKTDYNIHNIAKRGPNPYPAAKAVIDNIKALTYESIYDYHVFEHGLLYNTTAIKLKAHDTAVDSLSTPERLVRYAQHQADPQLPMLYYNFGRYLLISSSAPGGLPANLQGLWATEYQTPWNGDYHININLQMNYWLAEANGLSTLTEPLLTYIAGLVKPGQRTAKAYYDAPGWVAHVICNPWGFTAPGEGAEWGSTLTGGAWLCNHVWEHFNYTRDTAYLKKYYPVLKGAAQFISSVLIEEPTNKWLVTAPSNSPENTYIMPNGFKGQTAMGPTMDMQIARELFGNTIKAAQVLRKDAAFARELEKKRSRLAPNQVGAKGDLNEWLHDWEDAEPQHRHVSHLYGLHPYDEITPWGTPALAKAVRETLRQRGDGGTGWSKAWKINFWARLGDGDHALTLLHELLTPVGIEATGINMRNGGGTYANLFCAHPPFQIDGNFGGTAGISEMLLQSHGENQVIRLLPALPSDAAWQAGEVHNMIARGAFKVSFAWQNGQVTSGNIYSEQGSNCAILLPANLYIVDNNNEVYAQKLPYPRVVTFETIQGTDYKLTPRFERMLNK
ncbi:alpha-L-fucosidase 2 [Chitinophaga skermanii]|uniref:Alpha-L-fucosidase 2 n=1 Tax=Chitinophaga skermanii TaxID=331697 RepID=A0A327R5I9_9BACT|nr:glycoside hydrolase N-terminal domain-containing protein [Chitinophaga skermanii]RAJ10964.1 alpha-L-fucosidase 2 [Chitinophaga skermanii]